MSTVFEVRTSDTPVIVKVYEDEWAWKQAKEVHVYGLLAERLEGSIPTVLLAADNKEFGKAYTVMTKLDGQPLSEVEQSDRRMIYQQVGRLLRAVHEVPQSAYGYLTDRVLDPLPTNELYMRRRFEKKLREFAELGGERSLHGSIERYVAEHVELLAGCTAPVLCHNDFHEGNVLVDGLRVTGFVDVENAIAADPLLDLAKTDCYSIRGDDDKLAGLVNGYGDLPDDWRERMKLYRIYHALELWDWFCSIGNTGPLGGIAADIRREIVPGSLPDGR